MGLLTKIWNRVARARATDSGEGQARFLHDLLASTAYHGPSDDEYVEKSGQPLTVNAPKLIAFYLPQFHPIAENDSSWGEGFTEWTNTTKALPQFAGHYQPRLPGALGFYDLRLGDVQVKQAELAKLYGIGGFCYHYYWFAGRRVLNQPVEQMLANPKVDIPFCINWANESWSRKWDGHDDDVIVPYSPDPESDRRFIEDAIPFFRDPRYIRIDGKPLLMVYRAARLSDARAVIEHWRARARLEGLPGLYVVCVLSHLESAVHEYGVDAAVEFPPHGLAPINRTANYLKHNPHYSGLIANYAETVAAECVEKQDGFTRIRCVFPSWDNEARAPGRSLCFTDSTPSQYKRWLSFALTAARRNSNGPGLVFVNAWNEWAEGAYLEPDRRFGFAYLHATREALMDAAQ